MLAPYASNNPIPPTYGRLQKIPFRSDDQIVYVQGQLNSNVSYLGEPQTLTLVRRVYFLFNSLLTIGLVH